MSGGALDVVVKFIADSSSVTGEMSNLQKTGNRVKGALTGLAAGVGTAFAADKVKDFVGAAEEANSVSARLAQTMKNAGDETGKWTKHAEDLATSLMNKTGIDDEVIKGGQSILATFHAVSDASAQQAGIFDRASTAAVDLSKAGFGSVDAGAKALGKALQDPVKGISALARAGVNFTPAQKAMIQSLVDTGDVLGAQKIILGEVEGQVGGVAEKTATSADKMRTAWGETQESLGNALLPVLQQLAPILQKIAKFVQQNAEAVLPLVVVFGALAVALKIASLASVLFGTSLGAALWPVLLIMAAIAALIAIGYLIVHNWDTIKDAATAVWNWVLQAIQHVWDWIVGAWHTVSDVVTESFNTILSVAETVWNWITDNWPTLLAVLTGPIGIAVLLITKNWDTIKDGLAAAIAFLSGLWDGFVSFVTSIPGRIASALGGLANIIKAPFVDAWGYVQNVAGWISDAFGSAIGAVKNVWNAFARGWNGVELKIPSVHIPWPIDKDVGGITVGLPNLPTFAKGGIVNRATLALIGEAGPEAVVPLNGQTFGPAMNVTVNVTVGPDTSPAAVGAAVVDRIRAYERVAGKAWRAS